MTNQTVEQIYLQLIDQHLAIWKSESVPAIPLGRSFFSVTITENEISMVTEIRDVPKRVTAESGWRAFRVAGPLDFNLVGIIAHISTLLAKAKVPLFVISTFDTDHILVKKENLHKAIDTFEKDKGITLTKVDHR